MLENACIFVGNRSEIIRITDKYLFGRKKNARGIRVKTIVMWILSPIRIKELALPIMENYINYPQ